MAKNPRWSGTAIFPNSQMILTYILISRPHCKILGLYRICRENRNIHYFPGSSLIIPDDRIRSWRTCWTCVLRSRKSLRQSENTKIYGGSQVQYKNKFKYTNTNWQNTKHKFEYTNTNSNTRIQIQIRKYRFKYVNTNSKYANTNWNTQIQIRILKYKLKYANTNWNMRTQI